MTVENRGTWIGLLVAAGLLLAGPGSAGAQGEALFSPPGASAPTRPDAPVLDVEGDASTPESGEEAGAELEESPGARWLRSLFPETLVEPGFLLPWYQWICILLVVLLGVVVDHLVRNFFRGASGRWLRMLKVEVDPDRERALWKPLGLLAMSLTWYAGTVVIGLPAGVRVVLLVAVQFFAVLAAIWTAMHVIDLLASLMVKRAQRTQTKFDDLLVPLISRTLKVFVVCVGVLLFAETFNLPLAGLLSGLGLGGLAMALAAKDTVSNLFGSITVLTDRPFEIGDWIVTGDVEGTVESVGLRSTRVRTFYNSVVTVPNSSLTTATVDNMGKRRYRRIKSMLGLEYNTPPERIEAFCEGVRELLRRHPYTRKDYFHVYLNQFSASSLDVLLYCFIECPDWSIELRERERLFLDILRLADRLGVGFAFPTRTLLMHPREPSEPAPPSSLGEPLAAGRHTAAQVAGPPLSRDERPGRVEFLDPFEVDDTRVDAGNADDAAGGDGE